jgi:hypothetical protein
LIGAVKPFLENCGISVGKKVYIGVESVLFNKGDGVVLSVFRIALVEVKFSLFFKYIVDNEFS